MLQPRMGYQKVQIQVTLMNITIISNNQLTLQKALLRLGNSVNYRLVGAVIYHNLGIDGGHYTSYFLDHILNQWIYADDDKVLRKIIVLV